MINYTEELNPEQLAVVENGDGPCLVLAGAGSGKTRTITYRVASLLEKGVNPENILLVTFTNKAAKEMIDRVATLTKGETRLPWSGTFHHIGFRILKRYAPLLGYKTNFTILDTEDSRDVLKLCLKQEGIDRTQRRFPSANVLHSIISYARNAEMTIEDVLDLKHPRFLDIADTLSKIASDYERRKREANAMDFDDLLVNLYLLLLKSESVRKHYSEQFQYVLVDEYQDTNKIQASIVRLFASAHKNLLIVGDDAQSIYSFRAANIENILGFEKEYPGAKIFRLETNYRSTPEILELANDVIANNTKQYDKKLKSMRGGFTKPEVHAFTDSSEEAQFIAGRILELRDEGVALNHIAVLFRAAFHSQALEMELVKRDIPYEYRGGVRFFERAHVKDVLAYLRIVNNLEDTVAWSRVLTMQVGIGPSGAERIVNEVLKLSQDVLSPVRGSETGRASAGPGETERGGAITAETLPDPPLKREGTLLPSLQHLGSSLSARGQVGWADFLSVWEKMQFFPDKQPSDLIRAVLDSKYGEYLENEYPDFRERIQDLEQLAAFAEREEDLNKFLAEASLQESFTGKFGKPGSVNDEEQVVLSTIHQAKGLEWEAVFVLNVSAGNFPSDMALREENGVEEERRLFYVAITRAKKYLHLTYPLLGLSSSMLQGPSSFLQEIGHGLVDEHEIPMSAVFDPYGGKSSTAFTQLNDADVTYVSEEEEKPKPRSFLIDI